MHADNASTDLARRLRQMKTIALAFLLGALALLVLAAHPPTCSLDQFLTDERHSPNVVFAYHSFSQGFGMEMTGAGVQYRILRAVAPPRPRSVATSSSNYDPKGLRVAFGEDFADLVKGKPLSTSVAATAATRSISHSWELFTSPGWTSARMRWPWVEIWHAKPGLVIVAAS